MKRDILDLTYEELKEWIVSSGEPAYRAEQVFQWIYKKNIFDIQEMKNLPASLKQKIEKDYYIAMPNVKDHNISNMDRSEKFLYKLEDDKSIETVLIMTPKRATVCVSTQVGCKIRCPFCASGKNGFKRNLRAGEIVVQVLGVIAGTGKAITNIVFMGMGEPLDNYDNVEKAIKIFNESKGLNIGARRITVSTSGIIPGIKKLAKIGRQVTLSVSLHSADWENRPELVPADKKYPLKELVKELKLYREATGRIVTLEYSLFDGKNDLVKDAGKLAKVALELGAKVNIIPYNETSKGFKPATKENREKFIQILRDKGANVTLRRSKGGDITAACGQLALREEKKK